MSGQMGESLPMVFSTSAKRFIINAFKEMTKDDDLRREAISTALLLITSNNPFTDEEIAELLEIFEYDEDFQPEAAQEQFNLIREEYSNNE